jgi:Ni2+-binding GTPase involved in maturation of urease and hydrogenase
MVGGFLGAGKTTAILRLATLLTRGGLRVGLITNDQSIGLVDTALLATTDLPVEEITGGCFCCRFGSLIEAAGNLSQTTRPDVFIAEPVGSCTDLVASVSFPLRTMYGDEYDVAPLSVLVDPIRAERILGLEPGAGFSPRVVYVYRKQLEEAELIVINKCDLISAVRQERLEQRLKREFPGSRIVRISARDGAGLPEWLEYLTGAQPLTSTAPDVDYDIYAEGEALLGWLNVSAHLSAPVAFDGNRVLQEIASATRDAVAGVEIAHLKMTLMPDEEGGDIGVLNLVRSDGAAELAHSLREPLTGGELLVNMRAEGDPEQLRSAVLNALQAIGCTVVLRHVEHFRPAKPEPTWRMAHI